MSDHPLYNDKLCKPLFDLEARASSDASQVCDLKAAESIRASADKFAETARRVESLQAEHRLLIEQGNALRRKHKANTPLWFKIALVILVIAVVVNAWLHLGNVP